MKLLLAGEGRHELGDWIEPPQYRDKPPVPGVLEALLKRIAPATNWEIAGAVQWKAIRKFRAGDHRAPETRTIRGVVLEAERWGCDVLVFTRDRDGDAERECDVQDGIKQAQDRFSKIVGGMSIEKLEAWVLAIAGFAHTQSIRDPERELSERLGMSTLDQMLSIIEGADLSSVPADAKAIHDWLARARHVLLGDG